MSFFYVVSRWANNNNTIFHRIARASEQAMTTWYCKERTSAVVSRWTNDFIVIRERSEVFFTCRIARSDGDESIFTSYPKRRWRNRVRVHVYHIIAKTRRHNIFWCCRKQSSCWGATTVIRPSRDARMQQSNFSCCLSKDDSNKRCWWWDNGNERTLVRPIARSDDHKRLIATRDARSRHATTNKKFIPSRVREQLAAIRSREGQWWAFFIVVLQWANDDEYNFLDRSRGSERSSSVKIKGINQRMIIPR